MKLLAIACALGLSFIYALPAFAQSVSLRTEKIYFKADFPNNWCVLETSNDRDAFFLAYLQKASGRSLKIHFAAMPCEELTAYRTKKSHLPLQFLALSQVGIDGSYVRFLLGKGVYASLISSFDLQKGIAKIEKRTADKLKDYGDEVTNMDAKILGPDKSANTWMQGSLDIKEQGEALKTLQLLGSTNLVDKYPFAVFYGSTESTADLKASMSMVNEVIGSISK